LGWTVRQHAHSVDGSDHENPSDGPHLGSTAQERALEFACDRFVAERGDALYRAVTVNASPAQLFRWLCQLRAAPYSYDWIDNLGRRSPRRLTPGLDRLQVGQRIMRVFQLAAFEPDRHITAVLDRAGALFGDLAVTYLVVPEAEERCRLVVKLAVAYPPTPIGAAMRGLLPAGDLVMMRKQLLTLKQLAERDADATAGGHTDHEAKARPVS
jgi:hypothetical protein